MANKNNWDKIQSQSNEDNARFRDVYEDQQLDRSHIAEKVTMKSRAWIAVVAGLAAAFLIWWIVALIEWTGVCDGINGGWNDVFYLKKAENSNYRYVTIRVIEPVFEEDGITPVFDENGKQVENYIHTRYILNRETMILTDCQSGTAPIYTGALPYIYNSETETFVPQAAPEGYDYLAELPVDENGNPLIPRVYLKLETTECDGPYYLGRTHLNTDGDVYLSGAVSVYIDYNNKYGDSDDIKVDMSIMTDPKIMADYGFTPGGNVGTSYHLYYGEVIQASGLLSAKRPFSMAPTPLKLVIGFIVGAAVFGILWQVLKKNLDAQNIMTETSDINQYHNDQHIALPEEVQRLYDVFPDVGAHSTVMVSSMISHQMLTNKGLKKIKLARRAKEDIKDEDGDVVVFKGDVLRDDNGEILYDEVPLIDNDFSEALFDSSKTPKDKYARKYYNAPAIPYNPGNENLDKLKNYDTVADVINKDWQFPYYEPQRPGGVYIVDTAPVNTMV